MEKQEIRTFGRIHGKKLSARQQWLVDNILPAISPKSIEKAGKNIILEIGFGSGEHLRELAIQNPDSILIGAEPFINGVASLLSRIARQPIENGELKIENSIMPEYKNIKIWPDDVRKLIFNFQFLIFNSIYILHPDPWPKARHEKRRLLSAEFLNLLAGHLAPHGEIIIGTDHWEYYDWIVEQVKTTNLKSEILNQKSEIIETRYQKKNKAGTFAPKYLVLNKS